MISLALSYYTERKRAYDQHRGIASETCCRGSKAQRRALPTAEYYVLAMLSSKAHKARIKRAQMVWSPPTDHALQPNARSVPGAKSDLH